MGKDEWKPYEQAIAASLIASVLLWGGLYYALA